MLSVESGAVYASIYIPQWFHLNLLWNDSWTFPFVFFNKDAVIGSLLSCAVYVA